VRWRDWRASRLYIGIFLVCVPLFIVVFNLGLFGLHLAGRLPPPPVTGTWCIDEKMASLRSSAEIHNARIVAVGSSVTMRSLDFSTIPASISVPPAAL
jgi:hypothetical protein